MVKTIKIVSKITPHMIVPVGVVGGEAMVLRVFLAEADPLGVGAGGSAARPDP